MNKTELREYNDLVDSNNRNKTEAIELKGKLDQLGNDLKIITERSDFLQNLVAHLTSKPVKRKFKDEETIETWEFLGDRNPDMFNRMR